MLELTTDHDIEQRFESGTSNLSMLVDESCEKCPTHDLTEMDQLITTTDGKLLHALAALNNDLTGWVHTESTQNVHDFLSVGAHAIEDSRGYHDGDDLGQAISDLFTVLRRVNHLEWLLIRLGLRLIRELIKALNILCVEAVDQDWDQVGDAKR